MQLRSKTKANFHFINFGKKNSQHSVTKTVSLFLFYYKEWENEYKRVSACVWFLFCYMQFVVFIAMKGIFGHVVVVLLQYPRRHYCGIFFAYCKAPNKQQQQQQHYIPFFSGHFCKNNKVFNVTRVENKLGVWEPVRASVDECWCWCCY